jgi:hypothetical protein
LPSPHEFLDLVRRRLNPIDAESINKSPPSGLQSAAMAQYQNVILLLFNTLPVSSLVRKSCRICVLPFALPEFRNRGGEVFTQIENGAEQIKSQRFDIWRDSIRESQVGFM